jgi:hypothetical protein
MKKFYLFLSLLLITGLTIEAQELKPIGFPQAILKPGVKKIPINNKVSGTVLYSEDFDSTGNAANNSLPSGWTSITRNGSSNLWIWSNTAPGGQYSTGTFPLQSTTGANGFLSLPSDFYNTPFPVGGPDPMDAIVASPPITIAATSSVLLRFEHTYRYCCDHLGVLVVEVSSDGVNWVTYDVTKGRSAGTAPPNPEVIEFNVSGVLANQPTAYIRFRQTNATHYYFMVDDLQLIGGQTNGLEIIDFNVEFQDGFLFKTVHTISPYCHTSPMKFNGVGENVGANTQSNVNFQVSVHHDSTFLGSPGMGLYDQRSDTLSSPMLSQQIDTFKLDNPLFMFGSNTHGYFRFHPELKSDSVNQAFAANVQDFSFVLSDTVLARDRGVFASKIGPQNYVGGGNDGDKWGVLYSIYGSASIATSISIFVANDTANIGASIQPRVWWFDDSKSTLDSAISTLVGSSPFTTSISSNELGKWVSLPVFPPASLNSNEQYVVGWEQTNIGSNVNFIMGRDLSMESISPAVSNFVYVNDANPSWNWVTAVTGIRLGVYFSCYSTIEEKNTEGKLSIYPNPTNGQFAIRLKAEKATQYTLKVRNNLGQIVLEEQVTANGNFAKAIDLSENESGIYFLSLENGAERYVEKIVVQ